MHVQRLHHASVPRPYGEEARTQAVRFYAGILGLEEIPKPRTFTEIDTTWFRLGDSEVHIYAIHPNEQVPHSGAHFCLIVEDLQAMRDHLERAGCRCEDAVPIPHRPRFYTYDPFGNQIEITTIDGDYTAP
jgi:catechol 2,3-dioxygenase-like lactoylglutathione lyase family enzyme